MPERPTPPERLRVFLDASASRDPPLHARLSRALEAVRGALHCFGGPRELAFSFNGGKDCTLVLELLRLALHERGLERRAARRRQRQLEGGAGDREGEEGEAAAQPLCELQAVRLVYFEPRAPAASASATAAATASASPSGELPAVLEFIARTGAALRQEVETLRGGFKAGLDQLLREGTRCVLMGTRRADPDGAALEGVFAPCSLDWPPVLRACPALHLTYRDVWKTLRGADLDVCALYALGYTSLGGLADSAPNPALRLTEGDDAGGGTGGGAGGGAGDGAGAIEDGGSPALFSADELRAARQEARARGASYLPAWFLGDDSLERLGRHKRG